MTSSYQDMLELHKLLNSKRIEQGLAPLPFDNGVKKQRNIQVSDESWTGLHDLARDMGFPWGSARGNVSAFLEGLGQGLYLVQLNEE